MALFVPTTAGWDTAITDREQPRYYKVLIDIDDDDVAEDVTSYLRNNSVTGGEMPGYAGAQYTVTLRNSDQTFDEGDFAGAVAEIQAQAGSEGYITIFTGYVSDAGAERKKRGFGDDVVVFHLHDRVKHRGTKRKTDRALWANYKISDTGTPSSSIIHKLAAVMGIDSGDVDIDDITITKDFVKLTGQSTAWAELQKLAQQYLAKPMCFRYDGKLRFISRHSDSFSEPSSEWTFQEGVNIHSWDRKARGVTCTRAKTEFNLYEQVGDANRVIYFNTEGFDQADETISIALEDGDYWPGPNAGDKALLKYGDPVSGEAFPLGTSIQEPTIGAAGSGSDIEASGGLPTLVSFNGSTAATQQNFDSSEIILLNETGGTITIKKLTLRGTAHRISEKHLVEDVDGTVADEDQVDKTIPGDYAASVAQATTTCEYERTWGADPTRIETDLVVDWLPQIQKGAVVSIVIDTEGVSEDAVIESYTHLDPKGPMTKAKTKIKLIGTESFTPSSTASVEVESKGNPETVVLNDGGIAPGSGTTTPSVPTIEVCEARFNFVVLKWDRQAALRNFARYEIQCQEDGDGAWYALDQTGSGKGAEGQDTDVTDEFIIHSKIPFGGTAAIPTGVTYNYRVRRVTQDETASSYSSEASATTVPIAVGDLGIDSVDTEKIVNKALTQAKVDMSDWLTLLEAPTAYWSLNDVGADQVDFEYKDNSGNGHTATASEVIDSFDGPSGPCPQLDGSNWLTMPAGSYLEFGTGDFLVGLWISFDLAAGTYEYLLDYRTSTSTIEGWFLGRRVAGDLEFRIVDSPGVSWATILSDAAISNDGIFHWVVVGRESGTLKMYIDGELQSGSDTSSTDVDLATTLKVGARIDHTFCSSAKYAHIRLYDSFLGQGAIKWLMQNPTGNIPAMFIADLVAANSILAEHLSVIAQEKVNNPTVSKHLGGWGHHDENGALMAGESTALTIEDVTYQSQTVKAMRLTDDYRYGVRSHSFPVSQNKIYKISVTVKCSAADGILDIGPIGEAAAFNADEGDSLTFGGTYEFDEYYGDDYSSDPRGYVRTIAGAYFLINVTPPTDHTTYTMYIVGMDRSIAECQKSEGPNATGNRTIHQIADSRTTHCGIRFLLWDATGSRTDDYINWSVTEVGSGTVVASNILVDTLAAIQVNAGAITIGSGASGYGNLSDKPAELGDINSGEGTKLTGIEDGADVTGDHQADVNIDNISDGSSYKKMTAAEDTKLAGIEAGATVGWVSADKDEIAQDQGFANYSDMATKYAALAVTLIDGGYINTGLVDADSILAGIIAAKHLLIGGDDARITNAEVWDQDDGELFPLDFTCVSDREARVPEEKRIVMIPATVRDSDQVNVDIDNQFARKWSGLSNARFNTIGIFKATVNDVLDPENLTTANWSNSDASHDLVDQFFKRYRFSSIVSSGAGGLGYQAISISGSNGVKCFHIIVRQGTAETDTTVGIYDDTAGTWRCQMTIDWTSPGVTATVGTLVRAHWYDTDQIVEITAISTSITVASTNQVRLYPSLAGTGTINVTAIMVEDSIYPTFYAPTVRPVGALLFTEYTWQSAGKIGFWFRPFFSYDVATDRYIISDYDPDGANTVNFACWYDVGADQFHFLIRGATTSLTLTAGYASGAWSDSNAFTNNTDLWENCGDDAGWIYFELIWDEPNDDYYLKVNGSTVDSDISTSIGTFAANKNLSIGSTPLDSGDGYPADGLMADLAIWDTDDATNTHYAAAKPYRPEFSIMNRDQGSMWTRKSFQMQRGEISMIDKVGRSVDVGSQGLRLLDASGKVVHDAPDGPLLQDSEWMGHLYTLLSPSIVSVGSWTDFTLSTWSGAQDCFDGAPDNVKGGLFLVAVNNGATNTTTEAASRWDIRLRPHGSTVWDSGFWADYGYVYAHNAYIERRVLIPCPVSEDNQIDWYVTLDHATSGRDLYIYQVGFYA